MEVYDAAKYGTLPGVSRARVPPPDITSTVRALRAPRRGHQALDQESVLAAAVEIVDQEGLAALTIRRLADALGVPIASIQGAVGRKENILRGLVELMLGEVDLAGRETDDWRSSLFDLVDGVHTVFMRHPAVAQLSVLQRVTGARALDLQEQILALLRRGDLSNTQVVTAYTMIASYLTGFTLLRISRTEFESEVGELQLDALLRQMPSDKYASLRALSPELATQTSAERFRQGLHDLLHDLPGR